MRTRFLFPAAACICFLANICCAAQEVVRLREVKVASVPAMQRFQFASDGPTGPGWTRPDQIARFYLRESLPALFQRTIRLDGDVPAHTKLSWIFTGPHAGVTVELTDAKDMPERSSLSGAVLSPGSAGSTALSKGPDRGGC